MKKIKYLLLVFVVLFTVNTQAQNETEISEERMEDFIKKMCLAPLGFRTADAFKAGDGMEGLILNFLSITKEDPNYKEKLTKWWNENNHRFICHEEGTTEDTRNPQHFLKRIVDLGMHKTVLYNFLLSDPENYAIDVNTIEIYNGKEETILDYIDNALSEPSASSKYNVKEIKSLRGWLVMGYNAKTAEELKK
ncbi:hypothetical protein [Winogradskyella sediminis]|uniref:Uncharacterized protein n=1 Tax=Winogradskyella sediminis TaxID=1382466 RepID=A0A1H1STK6_9FLAO|nr:hypothetical protein [Winogradskyella sediminis]SDS51188.1 hypothetical protein SAMN04489797_1759 [Winogradskyella sediminis]